MKKAIIFIFLIAGAFLGMKVFQQGESVKNVQQQAAAQNAPLPTITSTATYAVNYAIQTKDAAEAEAAIQAVTIAAGVATETASIGRTREAVALQITVSGATSTARMQEILYAPTKEAVALAMQTDRQEADQQKDFEQGLAVARVFWWFFLRGIVLFASIAGIRLAGKWFGKWIEKVDAPPAAQSENNDTTPLNKIEIKNGSSLNYYKLPCTDEQVVFIANGVVNQGRGLSYARWTPESNGFSRGDWKNIVEVLLSAGMAVYKNGQNDENGYRVTPTGWGYFQKIASRPAPAPLPQATTTEHDA